MNQHRGSEYLSASGWSDQQFRRGGPTSEFGTSLYPPPKTKAPAWRVLRRVTRLLFVRDDFAMIAAALQCDVDDIRAATTGTITADVVD